MSNDDFWTNKIYNERQNINHEKLLTILKELQEKVEKIDDIVKKL